MEKAYEFDLDPQTSAVVLGCLMTHLAAIGAKYGMVITSHGPAGGCPNVRLTSTSPQLRIEACLNAVGLDKSQDGFSVEYEEVRRLVWYIGDDTVLDWHRELIENHVKPGVQIADENGNLPDGITGLPDFVYAEPSVPGSDHGWALYGEWEGHDPVYLGNVDACDVSPDLCESLDNDNLQARASEQEIAAVHGDSQGPPPNPRGHGPDRYPDMGEDE